jgi:hypothetical protein
MYGENNGLIDRCMKGEGKAGEMEVGGEGGEEEEIMDLIKEERKEGRKEGGMEGKGIHGEIYSGR